MKRVHVVVAVTCALPFIAPVAKAEAPTVEECAALSEAGQELQTTHKLREARSKLVLCTSPSCPRPIRDDCARRVDQVEKDIPTIVFEITDGAGNDLTSVKITVDGALSDKGPGDPISLDPGPHTFRFAVTGMQPVEKTFVLDEGVPRHEGIVMMPPPPRPSTSPVMPPPAESATASGTSASPAPSEVTPTEVPAASSSAPVVTDRATPTPATPDAASSSGQRTVGLVVGAAGVLGVGLGAYFGIDASSHWSSSQSECSSSNCPQHAQAVTDHDAAQSAATVSTIAFIAGGAALAAGAVLWLTAPSRHGSAGGMALVPTATPGGGGLSLKGAF